VARLAIITKGFINYYYNFSHNHSIENISVFPFAPFFFAGAERAEEPKREEEEEVEVEDIEDLVSPPPSPVA